MLGVSDDCWNGDSCLAVYVPEPGVKAAYTMISQRKTELTCCSTCHGTDNAIDSTF